MMGSAQDYWAFGWEPWTSPTLEDLLPDLSLEERVRLQNRLRERERVHRRYNKNAPPFPTQHSKDCIRCRDRDELIIPHVRFALHHYNAKHPGEEFDAVKPLMEDGASFRGQMWHHVNFWARCRKSKKIKRFFAEVHYKRPSSSSVCSDLPSLVPEAAKLPSSSSACSDLPALVPEAEKPPSSSSACFDLQHPPLVPIVEVCTILEEPLDRHRKSCAFCRGHMDILHPKGRKFVCGNDKDRIAQQLSPRPSRLEMPFTCFQDPASHHWVKT